MKVLYSILFILISINTWGHGGQDHSENIPSKPIAFGENRYSDVSDKISKSYIEKVQPIFKKACFDCHSDQTNFPWYYDIPGIKQFIDSDIREARSHLDFSKDYPFISHEDPRKDLESILTSIEKQRMPPLKYRLMHSDLNLKEEELVIIRDWVKSSLILLNNERK